MTREEAKLALDGKCADMMKDFYIDMFVALGMLKLDAPRSIADRMQNQLAHTPVSFSTVWCAIDAAGLKLVDK